MPNQQHLKQQIQKALDLLTTEAEDDERPCREEQTRRHEATTCADLQQRPDLYLQTENPRSTWRFPPAGHWKMNSDASWNASTNTGGIGWIIRSWNGTPISAGYRVVHNQWPIAWLEALAATEGLKTIPQNSPPLLIELDSILVVNMLKGKEENLTELSLFIDEAKRVMSRINFQDIIQVERRFNHIAHLLARKAWETDNSEYWTDNFPSCFVNLNNLELGLMPISYGGSCPMAGSQVGAFAHS